MDREFSSTTSGAFSILTLQPTTSSHHKISRHVAMAMWSWPFLKNPVQVEASDYFFNSEYDAESYWTLNDREIQSTSYVYGAKLSPDGSLLFLPMEAGIDVYDAHRGILLDRVALPFGLSTNYDALVADGKDSVLLAIAGTSGNGLAVVDLTSLSEPSPLPYAEVRHPTSARVVNSASASPAVQEPAIGPRLRAVPRVTRAVTSRP